MKPMPTVIGGKKSELTGSVPNETTLRMHDRQILLPFLAVLKQIYSHKVWIPQKKEAVQLKRRTTVFENTRFHVFALFAGTDCHSGGERLDDEIGIEEGIWVPAPEVRRMLRAHEIEEASTCVALYRYFASIETASSPG